MKRMSAGLWSRISGKQALSAAIVLLAALALVVSACSKEKAGSDEQGGGTIAKQASPDAMVAKVNGKKITEDMVGKEMDRLASTAGANADPQQMAQMRGVLRKQAIENMINRTLLEAAAAKEGVTVAREQVTSRLDEIKKSFPSEQEFNQRISMMGMTPQALEQEIETGIKFESLLAKHTGEIKTPTAEEIAAFYDTNRSRFQQAERIRARHILVSVGKDDTPAQKAEKRAKAAKIRADLVAGADFATTAAQVSDCPSKQQGGDLGFFGRGMMVPAFETAAFALKVGELSDIVETDFGYHLINVTEHEDAREVPLEEARQSIIGNLEDQQKQTAVNAYIQGLRSAAKIDYAENAGGQE
jgi:peptidyl-prolyl cis-trans isomerase C